MTFWSAALLALMGGIVCHWIQPDPRRPFITGPHPKPPADPTLARLNPQVAAVYNILRYAAVIGLLLALWWGARNAP